MGTNFNYKNRVRAAFRNARKMGLWANTYAMTDVREYFAEGVQSFFNYNGANIEAIGPVGGDGILNDIDTRQKVKKGEIIKFLGYSLYSAVL